MLSFAYASVAQSGGVSKAWVAPSPGAEDLYYFSTSINTWTTQPPHGCEDAGNTPCASSSGDFRALVGTSEKDLYAVGGFGLVLRYDGTGWKRDSSAVSAGLGAVQFDAAYTEGNLLTVAGSRLVGGKYEVMLFNYNKQLDRWYGPIALRSFNTADGRPMINAIAGQYNKLWFVGQQPVNGQGLRAWVLRRQ